MLKRFFSYYKPYKGLFALDFGSAIIAGLLELAFPLAVAYFIDTLLPQNNFGLILLTSIVLLVIYVLTAVLRGVVNYFGHMLGIHIETDMRQQVFAHLQKLSFRFFDNQKTGHLITHVTKGLEDIGEVAHHGPEDLFLAVMTFLGAFVLMFLTNWQLAAITVTLVPVMTWLVSTYGARMNRNWRELYGRVGDFNTRVEDSIGGVRVVKAFANEAHEEKLFAGNNEAYRVTKLHAYALMTASNVVTFLSTRLVQLAVMLFGAWLVTAGELSYGGFVSFLLLVNVFMKPIDQITTVLEMYPKGIAGFTRFTRLIDTAPDIADKPGAKVVDHLRGEIVFSNVSFAYEPGGRRIIDRLNLSVAPGETVAIVGPTGAGKSTISRLLFRFYDVTGGRITIDGQDIRDVTQSSLRGSIGIVPQDTVLFNDTIGYNIAYGREGAGPDEIAAAARGAAIAGFIQSLPDGFETRVGERGLKLSGGEKQRVAIARTLVKNPPILILDEATSALDSRTEADIQATLEAIEHGRTTIVIAHRLSTVVHADRIIVLEAGRVAEQGTHAELLRKNGLYAEMWARQAQEREAEGGEEVPAE